MLYVMCVLCTVTNSSFELDIYVSALTLKVKHVHTQTDTHTHTHTCNRAHAYLHTHTFAPTRWWIKTVDADLLKMGFNHGFSHLSKHERSSLYEFVYFHLAACHCRNTSGT